MAYEYLSAMQQESLIELTQGQVTVCAMILALLCYRSLPALNVVGKEASLVRKVRKSSRI